jgi:hypothetical protein
MARNAALAIGLASAMRADRQLARLGGELQGQQAFLNYVAQDVQALKVENMVDRHGKDRETERRLDQAEQAALVLAAEVRRLDEENGALWLAIRSLARRIEGR